VTTGLPTTRLGWTDMHITRTGFGAWAIGGPGGVRSWGDQHDTESIAAIRCAIESGVNWIDTAAVYGLGALGEDGGGSPGWPARDGPALRLHQGRPGLGSGQPLRDPQRVGAPASLRAEVEARSAACG
jgi:hypothetical protein